MKYIMLLSPLSEHQRMSGKKFIKIHQLGRGANYHGIETGLFNVVAH